MIPDRKNDGSRIDTAVAPLPSNEKERLQALLSYHILDTDPEQAFDDITLLASHICNTPIALISLIDENRQWFKSSIGITGRETSRDIAFCAHGILQPDVFVVKDARTDGRFASNPLVTGGPKIRFYGGSPLITADGHALGMLCVNDHVPRELSRDQMEALRALSRQVVALLEFRRQTRELAEIEERLRIVTDNAKVGLVIVNRDRRYMYANKAYADLFGLLSSSIIGQHVPDVLAEIYEEQVGPRLDRAFSGERVAYELHKPMADGDCHYEIRYEPTIVNGTVTLVVVVVTDITERKRAELASLRLAAIVEFSEDAIIGKDLTSIITSWNNGAEKIFGYTAKEMIGTSIMRLIPADRQDEETQILAKIRCGESMQHFETLRQTRDGRLIDVSVTASPIKDATGKPIGVSKVARDITERRLTEKELYRERDFISAVVDTVGSLVVVLDRQARIVRFNRACEQLTGYSSDDVLGQNLIDLVILPEERTTTTAEFGNLCAGQFPNNFENHWLTRHGEPRVIAWSNTALVDANGMVEYVIGTGTDITERKRTEEERRASELRYRTLFEYAPDGIVIADSESTYLDANESMCRMLGYTRDELIGLNARDIVVQAEFPQIELALNIIKAKSDHQREWQFRRKDGSVFAAEVIATLMPDGNLLGMIRDITERKRSEEALRESRATLDSALANMSDAVFITDSNGRFIELNDAFVSLHRFRDRDECYKVFSEYAEFLEVFLPNGELAPLSMWAVPRALRGETIANAEFTLRRKDTGETWVATYSFSPIRNNEGVIVGTVTVARDITERKRDLERIEEQAELLDKARDAILVRDLEGVILFWNKGAERMYGWTSQEVVGRDIVGLLYTNPKKFEEANGLTISQGEWSGELQNLTKDRGEITIEARWTLIRDKEGRPKSILVINTDITEKKKIEAQFMRAQRMESIGTLAGGIAHDLNNILAPIMMSIDILKSTSDSPKTTKILETIEISAKRGADIVRQVLSFARGLEGQRIEVQPKHLLNDVESIIKGTFPKDIRLQFNIPSDTWTILGDPTQVHQILLNLCVNARDAMPNGGSLIVGVENCVLDDQYVAMNLQANPGRYVIISVTDSGMGMAPGIIDKIFEPFFTTKDLSKGTGLGLSTVMAIVKSHDGFVNVYSEPGRGTTFKVYLPAMESSFDLLQEHPEAASFPRGNGEMILVVDDEASILSITGQTLQAFGYKVLTATDGADAIAVYAKREKEIDVVLTDMMMPVMDGPAMIYALMRMNPAVKIIAASGLEGNGNVAKVAEAGVKHFLTKPYTAGTLLKTMRAILDED
jgi:PAS domain S-box-containing protein